MGPINSRLRPGGGGRRDRRDGNGDVVGDDGYDDDDLMPVMGDGYCPVYDAALLGDWERLAELCEDATARGADDDDEFDLDLVDDDHHEDGARGGGSGDGDALGGGQTKPPENNDNDGPRSKDEEEEDEEHQHHPPPPALFVNVPDGERRRQRPPPPSNVPFVDARGNTALHLACRRDPPLRAIRALFSLPSFPPLSAWARTIDGCVPLHLACHCGCDVEVASALLDAMEASLVDGRRPRPEMVVDDDDDDDDDSNSNDHDDDSRAGGDHCRNEEDRADDDDDGDDDEDDDPLLPRDVRGRTPLHLVCASARDPRRRPDLLRLLLLRSANPRGAVLSRDRYDSDRRMGMDLALGELKVLVGGLMEDVDVVDDDSDLSDDDVDVDVDVDGESAAAGGGGDADCGKSVVSRGTLASGRASSANVGWKAGGVGAGNGGRSVASAASRRTYMSKGVGGGGGNASVASSKQQLDERERKATMTGRTPLDLAEDDYREELEEALAPGFSIAAAIKACRENGEEDGNDGDNGIVVPTVRGVAPDNLDAMYECWATLSVLVLAAGTPGTPERTRKALGGIGSDEAKEDDNAADDNNRRKRTDDTRSLGPGDDGKNNNNNNEEAPPRLLPCFTRPCHEVAQDFRAIHQACQLSGDACPPLFRKLAKKFLQGSVDRRSIAKVSDLRSQWEKRSSVLLAGNNNAGSRSASASASQRLLPRRKDSAERLSTTTRRAPEKAIAEEVVDGAAASVVIENAGGGGKSNGEAAAAAGDGDK